MPDVKHVLQEMLVEYGYKDASRLLGVSVNQFYRWLRGANEPRVSVYFKAMELLKEARETEKCTSTKL